MDRNIRTIEIEVKHDAGDDIQEGLLSSGEPLPVEVNIDPVRRDNEEDEMSCVQPALVSVSGYKQDIAQEMCNILPGNSALNSQTSLFAGKSGLQLQWKNQHGQILLQNDLAGNVEHLSDGKNLLVTPVQGSSLASDNQNIPNNVGTLSVGDSNVQYVYLTPVDSLYYVENAESVSVNPDESSIKQISSVNNNLQIINISTDKYERSVNTVFQSGGKVKHAISPESMYVSNIPSGDRKSVGNSASNVVVEKYDMNELARQQGEVGNVMNAVSSDIFGKKKIAPSLATEKDSSSGLFLRKGCDETTCVMNCSKLIPEERRREIFRTFSAFTAKERRKFILQHCSRKVVLEKAVVGTVRTMKHYRIDFNLRGEDGMRIQVCRLFFFATLGFGQTMFDNYISSIFPCSSDNEFLPLSCKCVKGNRSLGKKFDKTSECQLHSKITSHAHKDLFHNHIEGYLKTISIPDGDRLRTVRYLPKDISFNEMYVDFTHKHPEIPSSFEMYRNFIVLFTS